MRSNNQRSIVPFSVTDACNAHCVFCAQHVPRMTPDLRDDRVLSRLTELLEREQPAGVILGGGEPTLHPLLPEIVRRIRATGATAVLHTNGMRLGDPRYLQALVAADISGFRIGIFGHDAATAAEATRLPRAFELTAQGIDNALASGLPVELETPVNRPTQASLLPLAHLAVARWPSLTAYRFVPYRSREPEAPDALHVLPSQVEGDLGKALSLLAAAGIAVRLASTEGFHPCAFRNVAKMTPLLTVEGARDASGRVHLPPCQGCALFGRCQGVERSLAAHLGDAAVTPFDPSRSLAWLPGGRRTKPEASHIDLDVQAVGASGRSASREHVIRILHACNQRCGFCWVDFSGPEMALDAVQERIRGLLAAGGDDLSVTFTGGEPTLHRDLVAMIATAREAGVARIGIQTNATRLGDGTLAGQLAAAGLDQALVALHHHDAASSDALTAAPGTHARTVAGIRRLCEAGIAVTLNHVITRQSAAEFPAFIAFVARELGSFPELSLSLAVASHIGDGPLDPDVLPRMAELAAPFRAGLLLARAEGLVLDNLIHPCGVPPCVLDGDVGVYGEEQPHAGIGVGDPSCVKPDFCRDCRFDAVCPGIRKEYAAKFGTAEFHAVPQLSAARAAVIGLGQMGKRHAAAWRELLGADAVTALVRHDRDTDAMAQLGLALPPVHTLEALVGQGVSVVSIATPTESHAPLALPLLAAGLHVLCEKPLAADLGQAEQLAAFTELSGPRCFVAHTTRAEPAVQTLHDAIARGRIGVLQRIEQLRVEPSLNAGPHPTPHAMAQLYDLLIHEVSIFGERLADAVVVDARWLDGHDAGLMATVRTPELELLLIVQIGGGEARRELRASGTSGTLELNVSRGRSRATLTRDGHGRALAVAERDATQAVIAEVLDAIRRRRPSFLDAQHGLTVMRVAGAIATAVAPPSDVMPFAWSPRA